MTDNQNDTPLRLVRFTEKQRGGPPRRTVYLCSVGEFARFAASLLRDWCRVQQIDYELEDMSLASSTARAAAGPEEIDIDDDIPF